MPSQPKSEPPAPLWQDKPRTRSLSGYILRSVVVIIAFALALLLSMIVLMVLGSYSMGEELRNGVQPDDQLGVLVNILSMLFGGASFLMVVAPILTILPALLAVIIAEVAQIRSSLYYIVAGGLSVAVLPVLASDSGTAFNAQSLTVFATAGFVGGLVYWLLAGRKA